MLVLLIVKQINLIDTHYFLYCLSMHKVENCYLINQEKNKNFLGSSLADVVIHVVIQILDRTSLLILKVTTAAVVTIQH